MTERTRRDSRLQAAIGELESLVLAHYPDAAFETVAGEDPDGIYLEATVDTDDPDRVMDLVIDRLLEMEIDEGLPLYFVPLQPLERARDSARQQPPNHGAAALVQLLSR